MLLKCSFISGVLLTQCIAALHGFPFTKTLLQNMRLLLGFSAHNQHFFVGEGLFL